MTSQQPDAKPSILREYYESLLIVLILLNFVRIFAFQTFKIPSPSMVDNLLVGDHLLVNKFVYGPAGHFGSALLPSREIARGDIIVFRYPRDLDVDYVKRVIGLPGETIMVRDKQVFINGKKLEEPYKIHQDPATYGLGDPVGQELHIRDQFGPYVVPSGAYFAMGDNRDSSADSRYWGPVPRALIKGKPVLVYWSYRGEPPSSGSPGSARVKELLGVAIHFFSLTRWDRTFFIVDSRYHYHPEPENSY